MARSGNYDRLREIRVNTPDTTPNTPESQPPKKRGGRGVLTPELIANIWKPGQCGNPNGKNRRTFCDAYRDILNAQEVELHVTDSKGRRHVTKLKGEPDIRQAIAVRMASQALHGEVRAATEMADRTDGKVPQAIGMVGDSSLHLTISGDYLPKPDGGPADAPADKGQGKT